MITLEEIQCKATKLIPEFPYEERLHELKLLSLKNKWPGGQLIEVLKIIKGFDSMKYEDIFERTNYKNTSRKTHMYKLFSVFSVFVLKCFLDELTGTFFTYKVRSK